MPGERGADPIASPNNTNGHERVREKEGRVYRAEECLEVYEMGEGVVVVFWKLQKIDEWMAPVLGAACKELLGEQEARRILFDFSAVEEMSTAAIGTLVRFQNTIVHLGKEMVLVAGARLREQLKRGWVDRMLEIREHIYSLVGSEIQFVERPRARVVGDKFKARRACASSLQAAGRVIARWAAALIAIWLVVQTALAQQTGGQAFPSLRELEQMLAEAPDLQALKLELQKHRLERSWTNQAFVYASHSQYFASVVPFLPATDFQGIGGTSVGISVSVSLARLLGKSTPEDIGYKLKELEYETLFQQKLATLRRHFREREKRIAELEALAAERRTAELELEQVLIGINMIAEAQEEGKSRSFFMGEIDQAQAEEKLAAIKSQTRKTELEIKSTEAEILGLLGKGQLEP